MKIIGLCGGSGSGKSAVTRELSAFGIPSVNADEVYHSITSAPSECLLELAEAFGSSVIKNGALDRATLRSIVMNGEGGSSSLKLLNSITHKHVLRKMREIAVDYENNGAELLIFDAPLLFESGLNDDCFRIICVVADKNIRIQRIIERDKISESDAKRRISSQLSDEWLISNSHYVIKNNGSISNLREDVLKIINEIKNII